MAVLAATIGTAINIFLRGADSVIQFRGGGPVMRQSLAARPSGPPAWPSGTNQAHSDIPAGVPTSAYGPGARDS